MGYRFDYKGRSIAISGDTIAVSAALEGGGATYVYTRTGTTWGQPVRLAGSSWSVGLSADVLCVGDRGAATIYGRSGATWVVRQMLDIPVPNSTNVFVESCAVDGDTLAFGAPTSAFANSGYAFVFHAPVGGGHVGPAAAARTLDHAGVLASGVEHRHPR